MKNDSTLRIISSALLTVRRFSPQNAFIFGLIAVRYDTTIAKNKYSSQLKNEKYFHFSIVFMP